jgi:hypothetical protein
MKRKVLLPVVLFPLVVLAGVGLNVALAFDYEHPEKLSAGDCWITLPDGRVAIRSGRECPKPQPKAQETQMDSVPFWNNSGTGPSGYSGDRVHGGSPSGSTMTDVGDGIVGTSPSTEIPLSTGHPSYGRRHRGGHHGLRNYNHSSDNAGFKNGYPVHPVLPNLPADQKIFQEINKNIYPGVSNKTIKP